MSAQSPLTDAELRFAERAVRRRRLFLILSIASVVIAVGLAAFYAYRKLTDPAYPVGARAVVVLLILLNARMNLRQYRYAGVLGQLLHAPTPDRSPGQGARP
jgi:hypothetical protein